MILSTADTKSLNELEAVLWSLKIKQVRAVACQIGLKGWRTLPVWALVPAILGSEQAIPWYQEVYIGK